MSLLALHLMHLRSHIDLRLLAAPRKDALRRHLSRMRKRILIVDDDQDMVEMLTFTLEGSGFSVTAAADGVTALKMAQSLPLDLILLDLVLPELDGFTVCETLRRRRATAHIPILMLTGLTSQLNRYAGMESGANAYITKPLTSVELLVAINALLGSPAGSSMGPAL